MYYITKYIIYENNLYSYPTIQIFTIDALNYYISNQFNGKKYYLVKEGDSNESLIKSNDSNIYFHLSELN